MINPHTEPLDPQTVLWTPRLELGAWHPRDAEALRQIRAAAPDVDDLFGWPSTEAADVLRDWRRDFGRADRSLELAARLRLRGRPTAEALDPSAGATLRPRVGAPGFELRVWVAPDARSRGLGTELAGAATRLAFERLGAARVRVEPGSSAAGAGLRVAHKLGFLPAPDGSGSLWLEALDFRRSLAVTVELEAPPPDRMRGNEL